MKYKYSIVEVELISDTIELATGILNSHYVRTIVRPVICSVFLRCIKQTVDDVTVFKLCMNNCNYVLCNLVFSATS
jgi:hypothetical protein